MKNGRFINIIGLFTLLCAISTPAQAKNLIKNGDFSKRGEGVPAAWKNGTKVNPLTHKKRKDGTAIITVEIKQVSKKLGEIYQKVNVKANTDYTLEGEIWGDMADVALIQIKPLKNRQELARISTDKNVKSKWLPIKKTFNSGEADQVSIVLRYHQRESNQGAKVGFANIKLAKK